MGRDILEGRGVVRLVFPLLFVLLIVLRIPSLAQPAGADQGLYAYVGERILAGDWPYRDAWDQKPPAIHATYAAMFAAWPHPSVIAAVDLLVAAATTLVLLALGRRLGGSALAGEVSALLFLFLSNPAFGRLGGVRVRSQCEVFIALAVSLAFLLIWNARHAGTSYHDAPSRGTGRLFFAGMLIGLAATYKYNAAAYAAPALLALVVWSDHDTFRSEGTGVIRSAAWLLAGMAIPLLLLVGLFAAGGVFDDLYQATIVYNMRYSGETYAGVLDALTHLVTFPVRYARVDSLWWLGGLGSAVLAIVGLWHRPFLIVPVWVGAACVVIAINGGRGLPQYFVQAGPALALAAGLFVTLAWQRTAIVGRLVLVALIATGIWRVTLIPKAIDYTLFDLARLTGRLDETTYLARFGESGSEQKYSALAMHELAAFIREATTPADRVLVFGFSPGALMLSERESASRFFWSRPVIVGFNGADPRYGAAGLLADLERTRPRLIVLQQNDWQDSADSASFFLADGRLAAWLHGSYVKVREQGNFLIWRREGA